ncbi:MAG: tetratricopeptide repeat protein [Deltaproteobacteria bacterium]|nr:tetratricopeptide repeat protein [Deltaproteobacteria bacterium]
MKRLFDLRQVSRLAGISESQVRYWDSVGLIPHVERQKGKLFFDFQGLVAFRTVKALLDQGASLRKIRKCLAKVRHLLPDLEQPLSEVRVAIWGDRIIFGKDNLTFTPEGQLLIKFEAEGEAAPPVAVDPAEDLFFQGLEGEQQGEWDQAREKYEAALEVKPDYPDALVNLGNLLHRHGLGPPAEWAYRKALYINPDHPEANYNLANLFEERGDLDNALLFFRKAIHEDPEFADAHFNLGRVLEKRGDLQGARKHWRQYLVLDPDSESAAYIRQWLGEE